MKAFVFATLMLPVVLVGAINTSKYKLIDNTAIRNTPQTYYRKYIQLKTKFIATSPSMPYFIERTFSSKKYYMLIIVPSTFRVIAKRKKEFDEVIAPLKKGTPLILYGKVKKYSTKRHYRGMSQYYLDLDKIEIDKDAQAAVQTKQDVKEAKEEIQEEKRRARHDRMLNKRVRRRYKKPNVLTD